MNKMLQAAHAKKSGPDLKLGFVPLTDCAPVVMAHELGLFRAYGLRVQVCRELGWATIRDKVIYGELQAAHAVAGMPVAATLGLGSIRADCLTAMVLNLHGNGITLSEELWQRGVRDAVSLREAVNRSRGEKMFTFGVVYPFSSHHFLLRDWLNSAGIHPDRDVRIVVVPPSQMVANLKTGNLDGFCVGEPWNSMAIQTRVGWCVATSAELSPGHPDKVLMVRRDFVEHRSEEHLLLTAALLDACEYCDHPDNREAIIEVLARPEYVNAPITALRPGWGGRFDMGHDRSRTVSDFNVFYHNGANEPSGPKAAWVLQQIRASGLVRHGGDLSFSLGRHIFRADLFDRACALRRPNPSPLNLRLPTRQMARLAPLCRRGQRISFFD